MQSSESANHLLYFTGTVAMSLPAGGGGGGRGGGVAWDARERGPGPSGS